MLLSLYTHIYLSLAVRRGKGTLLHHKPMPSVSFHIHIYLSLDLGWEGARLLHCKPIPSVSLSLYIYIYISDTSILIYYEGSPVVNIYTSLEVGGGGGLLLSLSLSLCISE